MKKKLFLSLGLAMIIAVSAVVGAYAASKMTLIVNGKKAAVEPVVINGVTYVPLRAAASMLGADVGYDASTRTVTVTGKDAPKVTGNKIGDTQVLSGLSFTINSVEYKETGTVAPENDHLVVVDLTIKNTTNEAEHISTLMQMKLQDAAGYKHSPTIYIDGKGNLDGEIAAGSEVRGQVAFDVDKSDYKFIFTGILTGQITWDLK